MKRLRAVFMGTPAFSLPSFESCVHALDVVAVVTQPDRPRGRGLTLMPPPIKAAAIARSVPVYQPERIRRDETFRQCLSELAPDIIIVVAFGQILPESILRIPRFGCVNVHASLLPALRGAAPIPWAIIRGETETGVTTMQMDVGMDTGPILLQRKTAIYPHETAGELAQRLSTIGASLLEETLRQLGSRSLPQTPQDASIATVAPPLHKEDGIIRWNDTAVNIYNRFRGVTPWPGAMTYYGMERWKIPALTVGRVDGEWGAPGEVLKLSDHGLDVATGEGYTTIRLLQTDGGKVMTPAAYAAGHQRVTRARLGNRP